MIALVINTHSGEVFETEVDNYDPVALNDQINSPNIHTINIGDVIISRIDVKSIVPKREEM